MELELEPENVVEFENCMLEREPNGYRTISSSFQSLESKLEFGNGTGNRTGTGLSKAFLKHREHLAKLDINA